jgi:hypothetical protein
MTNGCHGSYYGTLTMNAPNYENISSTSIIDMKKWHIKCNVDVRTTNINLVSWIGLGNLGFFTFFQNNFKFWKTLLMTK